MFDFNLGLFGSGLLSFSEDWQRTLAYIAAALLVLACAYLLGSINSAIIVSRALHGDDIRNHGSGNAGLTNVLRTYGKGAAALTLLGDMLKSVVAVAFAALFFGFGYFGGVSLSEFCYLAGLFAVIGHVFPVYYGFRGGKGVLSTATAVLVLAPLPFLVLLLVFIIIVAVSKYVSLGSVTVASLFPVLVCGYILLLGKAVPIFTLISTLLLAVLVVWCHRENMKRVFSGTERKLSFKSKK